MNENKNSDNHKIIFLSKIEKIILVTCTKKITVLRSKGFPKVIFFLSFIKITHCHNNERFFYRNYAKQDNFKVSRYYYKCSSWGEWTFYHFYYDLRKSFMNRFIDKTHFPKPLLKSFEKYIHINLNKKRNIFLYIF